MSQKTFLSRLADAVECYSQFIDGILFCLMTNNVHLTLMGTLPPIAGIVSFALAIAVGYNTVSNVRLKQEADKILRGDRE